MVKWRTISNKETFHAKQFVKLPLRKLKPVRPNILVCTVVCIVVFGSWTIHGMHHSWYGRGQGDSTLQQAAVSNYIPTWNTFWLQFDLRQNLSEALASYSIDISSSIQFIISSQRIANFALFPITFQMLMRAFLFLHIDSNFLNSSLKIISDKP